MSTALVAEVLPPFKAVPRPRREAKWTAEAVETLRRLYLVDRMFASQVRLELRKLHDLHVSRSAVLGKANREGFSKGRKNAQSDKDAANRFGFRAYPSTRKPARTHEQIEADRVAKGKATMAANKANVLSFVKARDARIASEPVTLSQLRDGVCRWPIGDPREASFRFCGSASVETGGAYRPYCAGHGELAYLPLVKR